MNQFEHEKYKHSVQPSNLYKGNLIKEMFSIILLKDKQWYALNELKQRKNLVENRNNFRNIYDILIELKSLF